MQKEKPTKIYKSSNNKSPKKQGSGLMENLMKNIKVIVNKAMAGSVQHIAILVAAGVLTVAVVGGVVWGVAGLAGGNGGNNLNVQEIEIDPEADNKYDKDASKIDADKYASTILQETEDAGQEYISETLFVGDSNTVRSLMYDVTGNTWENVVGAVGIGIQHVASSPYACVTFTQPADPVDIVTAIKWIQPKRVVFTFGTNNASWTVESFIEEYKKAVETAYNAYPYFDVIINAIPPVDKIRDYPNVTMQQIDAFNAALAQMCEEEGYKFLNSAEALKDETTGFAKKDYTIGDGIHLSKNGFTALFEYIRTHAYETEDRRPELTYCPKRNEVTMPTIIQDPVAIRGGVKVIFTSSDYELGSVDGEVEQYVKYTKTSDAVTAVAKSGAKFTGWTCEYGGISDTGASTITYTAPMLDEAITEVRVVANFKKDKPDPTPTPTPTATPTATPGVLESITIKTANDVKEVKIGDTLDLSIITKPEKATLSTVTWISDKPEIATVAENGATNKLTALKVGTVKITASTNDGKLKDTIEIKVVEKTVDVTGFDITLSASEIDVNGTSQITVNNIKPDNATNKTATYSSSNEAIAKVDSTGKITGVAAGKATITVKVGVFSKTVEVTVKAAAVAPADKCEKCQGAHKTADCTTPYMCDNCGKYTDHQTGADNCPNKPATASCVCGSKDHATGADGYCPNVTPCKCGSKDHATGADGYCPNVTPCKCGSKDHASGGDGYCPNVEACVCGSKDHTAVDGVCPNA